MQDYQVLAFFSVGDGCYYELLFCGFGLFCLAGAFDGYFVDAAEV